MSKRNYGPAKRFVSAPGSWGDRYIIEYDPHENNNQRCVIDKNIIQENNEEKRLYKKILKSKKEFMK